MYEVAKVGGGTVSVTAVKLGFAVLTDGYVVKLKVGAVIYLQLYN